jgi:rhamnosyltransferase
MAGRVVSVVPTFSPPTQTVDLVSILASHGPVVVSDDASPCTSDPTLALVAEIPGVSVVRNSHNCGIGRALNQGLAVAQERGYAWLLTVDQDSYVNADYAQHMVEYADQMVADGVPLGALGAGIVRDASGLLSYPTATIKSNGRDVVITEEVVQSGTLWSVEALVLVGGFDESLGMDAVDAAACLSLRSQGLLVAVNPAAELQHQIEGAQQFSVLGKTFMVTGHSPARRRAIVRNRLRLFPREFAQSPTHALRTVRRSMVNFLAVPLRRR